MIRSGIVRHGMRSCFHGFLGLSLLGCSVMGAQKQDQAIYDLFASNASQETKAVDSKARPAGTTLTLRLAEVQAPAWLNTTAMQYRLSYVEPNQRHAYAESRWAAPPAEMLEQVIARQSRVSRGRYESGVCQLHVSLDEFIQTFDAPERSHAMLDVRAVLLAPGTPQVIDRRNFQFSIPADANARSGVSGFVLATDKLARGLDDWLVGMERDRSEIVKRCSN